MNISSLPSRKYKTQCHRMFKYPGSCICWVTVSFQYGLLGVSVWVLFPAELDWIWGSEEEEEGWHPPATKDWNCWGKDCGSTCFCCCVIVYCCCLCLCLVYCNFVFVFLLFTCALTTCSLVHISPRFLLSWTYSPLLLPRRSREWTATISSSLTVSAHVPTSAVVGMQEITPFLSVMLKLYVAVTQLHLACLMQLLADSHRLYIYKQTDFCLWTMCTTS